MNLQSNCMTATIATLLLVLVSPVQAENDALRVMKGMNVSQAEITQLESGDLLTFSERAYESTDRDLSADAMVLIQTDLDSIVESIIKEPTLIPSQVVTAQSEILDETDFSDIRFNDGDYAEVKKLFNAEPDEDLNFSTREYALLMQKLKPHKHDNRATKIAVASDAMREILIGRYRQYRKNGLTGIAGYARSDTESIDVGKELRLSTEVFKPFSDEFPQFYGVMHDYPSGAECCGHYFRWLKVRIDKRPVFVLVHTMVWKSDDYVLATERFYYVSSTLNSLQFTLSWLKYDEGSYMGLAMTANTDILDSMMGSLLRPIGRKVAKNMISKIMLAVKEDLE